MYDTDLTFQFSKYAKFDRDKRVVEIYSSHELILESSRMDEIISKPQEFVNDALIRPFRVSSGVFLTINGQFALLRQRDSLVSTYPLLVAGIEGVLAENSTPYENAFVELNEEILLFDKESREGIYVRPKREFANVLETIKLVKSIVSKNYGVRLKGERFVPYRVLRRFNKHLYKIRYYVDDILAEESEGLVMYDPNVNTLEIIYPIDIRYDVNKLDIVSLEPPKGIAYLTPLTTLKRAKDDFFVPRIRYVKSLL